MRSLTEQAALLRNEVVAAIRHVRPSFSIVFLWIVLASGLAVLTVFAAQYQYFSWDLWLTRKIQAVNFAGFSGVLTFATEASSADASVLWFIAGVSGLLLLRQPRLAFFAAAATWTHFIGGNLKLFVDRMRPSPELVERVSLDERLSYPSGHTEWVVGFEGFLVFAVWRLTPNPLLRTMATGAWVAHIVLTSVGRVDQGLHWPSDILAGLLVGTLALSGTIWAYRASLRAAAIAAQNPAPASVQVQGS